MKQFIYGLIDPRNGLIAYVGKTKDPDKRLASHISEKKKKRTLKNNWFKTLLRQNLLPSMVIIEECLSENVNEREIFWISYHRGLNPKLKNSTSGGTGGTTHNGKPTQLFCSNGKVYGSVKACARELNVSAGGIFQVLGGKSRHAKGFWFSRTKEGLDSCLRNRKDSSKPVCCSNGLTYKSMKQAGQLLGISEQNISSVARGTRNFAGGLKWWFPEHSERKTVRAGKQIRDRNTGDMYENCRAAAEALGLGYKRISAQILGTRPVTDKYNFEFVDQGTQPEP